MAGISITHALTHNEARNAVQKVAQQTTQPQLDITLGFMSSAFASMIGEKAGRNIQKIFCGPI